MYEDLVTASMAREASSLYRINKESNSYKVAQRTLKAISNRISEFTCYGHESYFHHVDKSQILVHHLKLIIHQLKEMGYNAWYVSEDGSYYRIEVTWRVKKSFRWWIHIFISMIAAMIILIICLTL